VKWGYISGQKPESERSKSFVVFISLKPRPSGVSLASPGQENMPQGPGNWAEVGQNHDAAKVVSATLSFLKWSGTIFRARSPKVSVKKVSLCPFYCKRRQSGVTLESPVPENILHFPGNRAKVGQNHDARKAVSAILSFLKWTRAIFGPRSSKVKVQKVLLCPSHREPSHIRR